MTDPPDTPSPNVLAPLTAYAPHGHRGGRAGRTWSVDELLPLLDPAVTVASLAGEDGPVRLVVPGDLRGGRYVSGIVSIEVVRLSP